MWNQNGSTYEVTLTLGTPDNIPEDDNGPNSGSDYFILISTSSNPIPGSTFKVQIPVDGVTLGSTALPSNASPANPNIIKIGMGGMMGSPVVISEIQTVGGGSNPASDEFIELYNRTPEDMDLSTWSIQYHDGASGNLSTSVPAKKSNLSGIIPSNGYFLIVNTNGYDDTKSANNSYPDSTISLSATGGTVFLVNTQSALTSPVASSIQDKVAWGTGTLYGEGAPIPAPPANGSLERKAFPESTTTSMITGIDVSMGNSFDSDDNASDFITRTTSEPQNNTDNECPEMSGTNPVVINEVYYKNSSTDNQWIELFNNAGDPMDLSDWKLYSAGKTYVFLSSTNIEANGYLVIHWNYGNPANNTGTELFTGTTDMLPMPSLAGDVFLTDEGDGAKDYVEYGAGGQASEMIAGGAQWPEGDYVPGVLRGESIGRGNNGYDTNKSSDWQTFISPTMGSMNSGGDSFAPDPVTNVVLVDNDTMNYGLNGEDVTVTWTPATAFDPTFDKYVIYLLAANVSLDTVIHTPFAQVY